MKKRSLFNRKIIAALIWFVMTLSLVVWWMILGMRYTSPGHERMIIVEGTTLILSFAIGGGFLIRYLLSERQRNLRLQEFFAVFNHEVKTYISSLRLKIESLALDLEKTGDDEEAKKIIADTVRLELQLENSLFLANPKTSKFYNQNLSLKETLRSLQYNWDGISISCDEERFLFGDQRAIETILKNLIQNSIVHAKATEININSSIEENAVILNISNNGSPFAGNLDQLGNLFYRHSQTSRSGVGLYLVRKLSKALGGDISFSLDRNNFLVSKLTLPGGTNEN